MIARLTLAAAIAVAVAPSASLAAPGWLAAAPVSPGGSPDFKMDVTPGGAVTVVWVGTESGHQAILTTMRQPGGGFTPSTSISQDPGDVGAPSLAVAPSGTALAVWAQKNAQGVWVVRAAVRSPAGSWSAAQPVSTATSADPTPVAAIADSGEMFVGWVQPTVTRPQLLVSRRLPGGSWPVTPDNVSSASDTASEPHLVVDAQGNATALWLQPELIDGGSGATALVVAASSRAANGQWTSPPDQLTEAVATGTASVPDLATSPAGRVAAIWYRYGLNKVESADHAFGAPWSAVTKAGNPSRYASDRPEIAVDGTGTATATWSDGSGIQATRGARRHLARDHDPTLVRRVRRRLRAAGRRRPRWPDARGLARPGPVQHVASPGRHAGARRDLEPGAGSRRLAVADPDDRRRRGRPGKRRRPVVQRRRVAIAGVRRGRPGPA
jgi:hypothetical protein